MNTYKILITYAVADEKIGNELKGALELVSAELVDRLDVSTTILRKGEEMPGIDMGFLVNECDIFIPVLTSNSTSEGSVASEAIIDMISRAFYGEKHILPLVVGTPTRVFVPNPDSSVIFSDTESLVIRVRELVLRRASELYSLAEEEAKKLVAKRLDGKERRALDVLCLLSPRYLIDEAELSDKARAGVKSLEKKGFIYRNENNGYIAVPEAISNAYYEAEHSPEGYEECLKMLDRWNEDSASKNEGHEKLYKHLSFFIEKRAHGVDEKHLCELEVRCERALASWAEGEAFSNSLNKMINIAQYNFALKDRLRYYLAKLERTKESADKGALASTYLSISEAYEALGDTRSAGEYREKARRLEE